ncbi:hypothetical protein [Stutzerimonas nitrititolerans]|uniref:hypothetical protein n=1 Tax=Stutzerimonas nitrititolerans TaxID=2482751 RepID=UPI0028A1EAD8|nr:hypothetical protein [Stutzerimonas nitrititolerans]
MNKPIHPAVAEHVMEENARLREVLRCIADLPMDRCSTENDYRLSAAKAIALGALSQQAEPTDTFTAVDMATAAAQGFRDGQAAVEQAAAQGEREIIGVERYRVVRHGGNFGIACVKAGDGERTLYQGHISDCERVAAELATAFEDGKFVARRTSQTVPQPEQSGLACLMQAIDFRRIELLPEYGAGYTARIYDEESEPVAEAVGHTAAEAIRAVLSAQGESHE